MVSKDCRSAALEEKRPKDTRAATKLDMLMRNTGLSAEVLGAQVGVSGKRIRQIVDNGDIPHRRVKAALAKRFELLPADIWKADARGLSPTDLDHLRALAKREGAFA